MQRRAYPAIGVRLVSGGQSHYGFERDRESANGQSRAESEALQIVLVFWVEGGVGLDDTPPLSKRA